MVTDKRNEFMTEVECAKKTYLEHLGESLKTTSPENLWKIVNNTRRSETKGIVQPIRTENNALVVSDSEIFDEIKKKYGKETLEVSERHLRRFIKVEEDMRQYITTQSQRIMDASYDEQCEPENKDISIGEIELALKHANANSAPSPEEGVFLTMLRKGGEHVVKALHFLFQKIWSTGSIPDDFKLDPKIMMPKPGKSNYNQVGSYRPITLESIIGKLLERIICLRLTCKLESQESLAASQFAYRKNKSCTQAVLRITQSIQEHKKQNDTTVLCVMDYESCFERIWRGGLLKKAKDQNITGRLWVYLWGFLTDRKYYIKVNNFKSPLMTSKVGIPQGSILSPVLCNLYSLEQSQRSKYSC